MSDESITLLLVEDDDIDAMSIQRSFKKHRIANPIHRVVDGLEALEVIKSGTVKKPFIILLDLNLPRMDGLDFLEWLRESDQFNDIVVFVLTTSKAEEDQVRAYNLHAAGYFFKSECGNQFLDVVSMLDGYWKIVKMPKPGNS
ncbi:response regulator [Bermanella marisrubri]|uniref:Response regulator n=1 Tax=Bermanella marisrubri TaxID=207949 RepID=Q1N3B0_9GAMM|nr:response regulator [Bermanella marisrubri]EAT12681.1 response regulator [Oceanobacter sp. RED65] [Bermanella marisrubri]QIZ85196.1 response regulator [Bermanella marisrubri]